MKRVYVLLLTVVVGIAVALTYYVFEAAVHVAIDYVWLQLFDTNEKRLLIIPIGLIISLLYFYGVHHIDPKAEEIEGGGLDHGPKPTIINYLKILFIGFLSLLAGASLGPEAILVPACMLVGAYVATKAFGKDKTAIAALTAAGFVALFAAFFNSFIVGLASLLLVLNESKAKMSPSVLLIAVLASASSTLVLWAIRGQGLVEWPPTDWTMSLPGIIGLLIIGLAGYALVYLIRLTHDGVHRLYSPFSGGRPWWQNAIVASLGLSVLYLFAGPLIQFTGNESIAPLIKESSSIGVIALLVIVVTKILAIAWSKAMGYRGGLIFPTIFVLTGIILIVNVFIPTQYTLGLIAGFIGVFVADRKNGIMMTH